ncbi:metal ABC transporter ATP-binding protein [Candidatus Spongiisocius sp.]|uniref:metal ABC transporter ATP-binding protein n=1 Tax=Candidatus Spongiisocius sp. TaxID=3101273 RepID=UPI003B5B20A0
MTVEFGGHQALSNVTFDVDAGTLMGVVGPNGAGKSTLFNAIAGLLPVRQGTVTLHRGGQESGALAYVPQQESVNWRLPVTAMDVVMMGRCCRMGWFRRPGKKDREIVNACLGRVGLWDHRSALMTELSGGQRQRVFIGRALAQEASVLLLDEAFSGVDAGAQEALVGVLRTLRDEGRIILLATHDLTNLAGRFDEVLCLNRHVCACGPPDQVFTSEVMEQLYGAHGVCLAMDGES